MEVIVHVGTHLRVPIDAVDMDQVRSDLYISSKAYETKVSLGQRITEKDIAAVTMWEEDGDDVLLPRGYAPPFLHGVTSKYEWEGDFPEGHQDGAPWPTRIRLRENQLAPTAALMVDHSDKLLCMGCGKGKTKMAIWYAAQRGRKTLVIVDRDVILDQWKREISLKSMVTYPGELGHIQGKKCTIGSKITVAMAHTLAKRDFPVEWYDQFGLVIFDEVHVASCPTFEPILQRVRGERLGLSATWERADGLHPVFMYHLGGMEPVYTDLSRDQPMTWVFKRIPRVVSQADEARCMKKVPRMRKRNGEPVYMMNRGRFETFACLNKRFNRIIIHDLLDAARRGRSVIVLGSRVEHLAVLHEIAQGLGINSGLAVGTTKKDERLRVFKECQTVFATDKLAYKALDIPRIDTLVLLFPTRNSAFVQQASGRLDRVFEGKKKPMVIIYSHAYSEPMAKRETSMEDIIRPIDPQAVIKHVGGDY
jgi:DNA excision repair protein ERCC-3